MELKKAQMIADEVVSKLSPYCERIAVAGSIRRKKDWVRDLDLVVIPSNQGHFLGTLYDMGLIKSGAGKLLRVELQLGFPAGLMLDVYIATPETWATLLLIRTGSAAHNRKLCGIARSQGMILHADGSGLFKIASNQRIAGDTETSVFEKLGLPYKAPEDREL
jgi:DNA polymerase (family 10)